MCFDDEDLFGKQVSERASKLPGWHLTSRSSDATAPWTAAEPVDTTSRN